MQTPLNASASSAGALISNSTFEIPQFQREYSWGTEEVSEFWNDLRNSIDSESYFLGLVILTSPAEGEGTRKLVVDGQQRLLTLSLLVNAIFHEAVRRERKALADRIQADFLQSIDYISDETAPRIRLADRSDNKTFQSILQTGSATTNVMHSDDVSAQLSSSAAYLTLRLKEDLSRDPFKRLGQWTEFLTNKLYFAVFVHPDSSSAYQVFEVVNTRGKDLTTADLLKNYVLSQTPAMYKELRYTEWQALSKQFNPEGTNNFVQYIRHVVTVGSGHVLPKDLFGFLAGRIRTAGREPPVPERLMTLLEENLPIYRQMIDPTLAGPSEASALGVFSALNSLGVIAVRPILLALANVPEAVDGMKYILRLVVRRIVVGNLGTGNVERRFGEAAKEVHRTGNWRALIEELGDLNPTRQEFVQQLSKRSFNKQVLSFLRRSIVQETMTPNSVGNLYYIWIKDPPFGGMGEDDGSFWVSTIGNTYLSTHERRPKDVTDWESFQEIMLPTGVAGEWRRSLSEIGEWDGAAVEMVGIELAEAAGEIWFARGK